MGNCIKEQNNNSTENIGQPSKLTPIQNSSIIADNQINQFKTINLTTDLIETKYNNDEIKINYKKCSICPWCPVCQMITDDITNASYDNTLVFYPSFTRGKIIKVYDGDTYWIAARHNNSVYKFPIRLYGVDCDELKSKDERQKSNALAAKHYVEQLILNKIVDVEIINRKEKFGRLLAKVIIGGQSLAELLIKQQLARAYFGGKK